MLAKLPSAERIDHIRRELNAAWKIQNAKHRARDDAARAVSERALKVDKGRAKRGRLIVELDEAYIGGKPRKANRRDDDEPGPRGRSALPVTGPAS